MTQTSEPAAEVLEHRLALVMNGGVSLAVWMGGGAREIDNARRASNGLPPAADASDAEQQLHARWVSATARARAKLTVDVIAGTSAGGHPAAGLLADARARRARRLTLRWPTASSKSVVGPVGRYEGHLPFDGG